MTHQTASRPVAPAHSDSHDLALAVLALVAMALLPVFLTPVAPLADWVNHLGRMAVMSRGESDPYLSAFYEIRWALIPNLAMDLIVPPLAKIVGVYVAGQLFMGLLLAVMISAPFAVQYAVYRRLDPFPLVVFLFFYNDVFLLGLANYLMGVGLAAWAFAVWILLRERSPTLRLIVSTLFVTALFVCHLYAAGLYGVAIGAYELHRWAQRRFRIDGDFILDVVVMLAPFAAVVWALLQTATWGLAPDYAWDLHGKIDAVLMAFSSYSDIIDVGITGGLVLAFVVAWRQGYVRFHGLAAVFLVLSGAVFLAMPTVLFGSFLADSRMPVAIVLFLVGFGRLDVHTRTIRTAFLAVVIGFSALRIGDVAVNWVRLSRVYDDFRRAFSTIEQGAKILVAHADEPEGWNDFRDAISHAPCLAMIDRSALVSTAFAVPGKQIMTVRPEFHDRVDTEDGDPPTLSRVLASAMKGNEDKDNFWNGWRRKHDYLVVLYTAKGAENPNPRLMTLVHDGIGYQLFKVIRPTTSDPAPTSPPEGE